jgi:hypothetical protein
MHYAQMHMSLVLWVDILSLSQRFNLQLLMHRSLLRYSNKGSRMTTFVPKEVQAGLDRARLARMKKASRLRISFDDKTYKVLRMWKTGFSIDAETAPQLRGLVDLYDGAIHLFQCLIIANERDEDEMLFEFKRLTAVSEQPAIDFVRDSDAPIALLGRAR